VNKIIFLVLFSALTTGCFSDPNAVDMALIKQKLTIEVGDYYNLKLFDCRNNILIDAELKADSLMVDTLNAQIARGLYFPNRPIRPNHIGFIYLDDSTKKIPILDRKRFILGQKIKVDTIKENQ
jgi:hypothetical protein